ncbi:hypothetical protein lerEdw1_006493 [Lerista edwardsae]|nr:hypothetical protein lerEdw1_006493 [Lerista edwardsae]
MNGSPVNTLFLEEMFLVSAQQSGLHREAMQQVLDNLSDLPNSMGAGDLDLIFLRGLMESPIVRSLAKPSLRRIQSSLFIPLAAAKIFLTSGSAPSRVRGGCDQPENAVRVASLSKQSVIRVHQAILGTERSLTIMPHRFISESLVLNIVFKLYCISKAKRKDLWNDIDLSPWLTDISFSSPPSSPLPAAFTPQSLLETHDSVASKSYETPPPSPVLDPMFNNQPVPPDAVRMVGIRKTAGEHLGVTFRVERGELVIARILHGGMIDQQGLLHVGDIIKEVNGQEVGSDPRALQEVLKNASGSVILKILPSYQEPHPPRQACHVEGGSAGLIPSQLLEEKRKAFVKRDLELTPSSEFDRHELLIYEEVARMPPFRRKTLVLIGAQGVGRRSLKNKLIMSDQSQYGTTIPYTSRRPKDHEKTGQVYCFVMRSEMEVDIKAGRYLEHGEYEGNLYGTKIDSIHEVVEAGKMCILDVNPQAVKVLRTAEFVPYVVFIEAPDFDTLKAMNKAALENGVATKQLTDADLKRTVDESCRIQRGYGHYFDLCLINDNMERTFQQLQDALEKLHSESQWVPVSWVY